MPSDELDPRDEQQTGWLAACDDAFAAGNSPEALRKDRSLSDLQDELEGELAFAQQLREVLRQPRGSDRAAAATISVSPQVSSPSAASSSSDLPMTSLGRFQIRSELGRGAFGV